MTICKIHNIEKIRRPNSTLFYCHLCLKEKNASKLKQLRTETKKVAKKGLKCKKLKTPRQKAMKLADDWFSRFIRIKYSFRIVDGIVYDRCIIDPSIIKQAIRMDNGHCFSRECKSTRYYEDNCRPQNRSSNRYSGEADHYIFIDNLKAEIGEERFDALDQLRRKTINDNEAFYIENKNKYQKLTNELIKEFGVIKWWKSK